MEGPSSQRVWVGVEFSLLEMSFPSAGQAVFFFNRINWADADCKYCFYLHKENSPEI